MRTLLIAFVTVIGISVTGSSAHAQTPTRVVRLGLLTGLSPSPFQETFVRALADHGYVEGKNLLVYRRFAEAHMDRLAPLADELIRLKIDVVFTPGAPATRVMAKASRAIPIIALDLETDPVAEGIVAGIARPGGNVTGVFLDLADMRGKHLDFLRDVVPGLKRLAVLRDPNTSLEPLRAIERAARAHSIELQIAEARNTSDLTLAFASIAAGNPQALLVIGSPLIFLNRERIVAFARERRLPAITHFREFADAGGLFSYGPNLHEIFRRASAYVPRILQGANPGDLPIERPEKYELVVNERAAAALGITIPTRLRMLADEIIR